MRNSLDVSEPWTLSLNFVLNMLASDFCHVYIPYQDILQGIPGFATYCPCGVSWCRGLTTCLLYVGPLLEILFKTIVGV